MTEETKMALYRRLLKQHDWTYDFSEDPKIYTRGREQRNTLSLLRLQLDPNADIWDEYAPDLCKLGDYLRMWNEENRRKA